MEFTVIGSGPGAAQSLIKALENDESPVAAYFSSFCKVFSWEARDATVLLTNQRIIIAKDRLLGKPRIDRSLRLNGIKNMQYGPLLGVGPAWVLQLTDSESILWSIQFSQGSDCEEFAGALEAPHRGVDPVGAFFEKAQQLTAGAPSGTQVRVDLYQYVNRRDAPYRFLDLLEQGPQYGFVVLDGATNMVLLEKA